MSAITVTPETVTPENYSSLLSTTLLKPQVGLDDTDCIAEAIAQRMDPEWRAFIDQEQQQAQAR